MSGGQRLGALFVVALLATPFFASCSSSEPQAGCGPSTCDGCCTAAGTCKTETSASFCGLAGAACQSCAGNQSCQAGACQAISPTCTQNGATSCNQYLAAYCARLVKCCVPDGVTCNASCNNLISGSTTNYNACNIEACKAWAVRTGLDCSAAKYASKSVCADITTKCVNEIPLMACTDILGGTANFPVSCQQWSAQF